MQSFCLRCAFVGAAGIGLFISSYSLDGKSLDAGIEPPARTISVPAPESSAVLSLVDRGTSKGGGRN